MKTEVNKDIEKKSVRVMAYIQDSFDTPNENKKPIPNDYMSSEKSIPDEFRTEMSLINNSWIGVDGNIHFSKDYAPRPFIGNDNEVYLHLGDITLKDKGKTFSLMTEGVSMLEKLENKNI